MKHIFKISSIIIFFSAISVLLTTCYGFNVFTWEKPTAGNLTTKSTDDLLYLIYRSDVVELLSNDEEERNKVIEDLNERIANTEGEEKIKNQMALALLLTKTTPLNLIINEDSTVLLLGIAGAGGSITDPRKITTAVFLRVPIEDVRFATESAFFVNFLINSMGAVMVENNIKFPAVFEDMEAAFAEQAVITGTIAGLLNSINLTADNGNDAFVAFVEYVTNFDSESTFANVTLAGLLLGTAAEPTGTRIVIETAGLDNIISKLEESAENE